MKRATQRIGEKHGGWTILAVVGHNKSGAAFYLCRCDCGVEQKLRRDHVIGKNSRCTKCARKQIALDQIKFKVYNRVHSLHEQGFSDIRIAKIVGLTRQRVWQIRSAPIPLYTLEK